MKLVTFIHQDTARLGAIIDSPVGELVVDLAQAHAACVVDFVYHRGDTPAGRITHEAQAW